MAEKRISRLVALVLGLVVVVVAGITFVLRRPAALREPEPQVSPPPILTGGQAKTWKAAVRKVEESRGEPVGRAARVEVPAELRHYADRRRFLAVQVAESREQNLDLPEEYVDLVRMIDEQELVEVPPVGDDYVLYGVGANVDDEPFMHYDRATGTDIPLYDGYADFEDADHEMDEQIEKLREDAAGRRAELRRLPRTRAQARRRRTLGAEAAGLERAADLLVRRQERIASFYDDYDRRRMLVSEYWTVADKAADFGGRSYDLAHPVERQRLKARLLSFLRPEARDVLFEIARDYRQAFDRPLPVTSLVRSERYQQLLGKRNPNATRIEVPPHATGLAFDVYYHYMTAAEQDHLMKTIAALESSGRAEALRETRDHIHVFAFAEGRRPDEKLIASSRAIVAAAPPAPRRPAAAVKGKPARTATRATGKAGKAARVRGPAAGRQGKVTARRPAIRGGRMAGPAGRKAAAPSARRGATARPR